MPEARSTSISLEAPLSFTDASWFFVRSRHHRISFSLISISYARRGYSAGRQDFDCQRRKDGYGWVRERSGPGESPSCFFLWSCSLLGCRLDNRTRITLRLPLSCTIRLLLLEVGSLRLVCRLRVLRGCIIRFREFWFVRLMD